MGPAQAQRAEGQLRGWDSWDTRVPAPAGDRLSLGTAPTNGQLIYYRFIVMHSQDEKVLRAALEALRGGAVAWLATVVDVHGQHRGGRIRSQQAVASALRRKRRGERAAGPSLRWASERTAPVSRQSSRRWLAPGRAFPSRGAAGLSSPPGLRERRDHGLRGGSFRADRLRGGGPRAELRPAAANAARRCRAARRQRRRTGPRTGLRGARLRPARGGASRLAWSEGAAPRWHARRRGAGARG